MSLRLKLIRVANEAIRILNDMDSDFENDTEMSESDEEGSADDLRHHQLGIINWQKLFKLIMIYVFLGGLE